ncbi:MAG: diguanylate cyclase [Erysipelotrichia bacterium]|nr:diguanylate cyclase [Erysipelotrichia bacterium]NCC54140.1 diguanylate cyclase [Erysipelotrichia bacterium]
MKEKIRGYEDEIKGVIEQLEQYKENRDVENLYYYADKLIEESEKGHHFYQKAIGLYYLSLYYSYIGDYTQALVKGKEGLHFCEKYKVSDYYTLLHNCIGVYYGIINDYVKSLNHFLSAYFNSLEWDNDKYIERVLCNIGTIFQNLGYYEKALEYYQLSLAIRPLKYEHIDSIDGIRMVNMFGIYVYLQEEEKRKEWEIWAKRYVTLFSNEVVLEEYHMYEVILAYDEQDYQKIESIVYTMIENTKKNKNKVHSFHSLQKVLEICIKIKHNELCRILIDMLVDIQKQSQEVKYEIKLNDLIVQLCLAFDNQEYLQNSLMNYYHSKKKEEKSHEEEAKNNALLSIELEKVLYEHRAVLKKNEELSMKNELDEFTKLYNKTYFIKHVEKDLENQNYDCYQALILLDLDGFKLINDRYGHICGDEVLIEVANTLLTHVRANEYVGRVGGDEFAIFMKDIYTYEYLEEKMSSLLQRLQEIQVEKVTECITGSIGVCMFNGKHKYKALFQVADNAMYQAKNKGKNQYYIIKFE